MKKIGLFALLAISGWANDPKPAEHGSAKPAEHGGEKKVDAKPAEKGHGETKSATKAEHGAPPAPAKAEAKPAPHAEAKAPEPKRTAPAKPMVHAVAAKPKAVVRVRTASVAAPIAAPVLLPPAIYANGTAYVLVPAASFMAAQGVIPVQLMAQATAPQSIDAHASTAAPASHAAAPHRSAPASPPVVSAEEALNELKKGNERHMEADYNHDHHSRRRLEEVAKGQKPHAIILTCSDSRVPPELVFDKGLGDLFVIRVAGNIAGSSELASIEYAAEHLNVPLVIVMGHKRCGAVQAAAAGGDAGGHIAALVKQIEPAVQKARNLTGDLVDNAVHTNVDHVVRQLRNSDPMLKEMVESGRLKVLGAYYDIDTGKVDWMY